MKHWIRQLKVYEPGKPLEETARDVGFDSIDEIIKLASNENNLGPSPAAVEALKHYAEHMYLYPDGGAYYLKQALADHHGLSACQVIPGNGSNELIELLGHIFLEPGKEALTSEHAFAIYELVAALFGAACVKAPMNGYTFDLDALADAVSDNTSLIFIANPNNPTGTSVSEDEMVSFLEKVPTHIPVVVDEAYIECMPQGAAPHLIPYLEQFSNLVILRTFSKVYGLAGLRVGYALASPEMIDLMNRVRQPFNVNGAAQAAAVAAIQDTSHVERTRDHYLTEVEWFINICHSLNLQCIPSVTNFICIHVGQGRKVYEALLKEGVIVRPLDGYKMPEFVRVTVGTRSENERMMTSLERVLGEKEI